jgi:sec-independent protein translocase protein TatA
MGFDALSPWHLLIIAVIFVMLFGAKKLPDSARSLGRSLRIFKAETSGLRHDENGNVVPEGQTQAQAAPPQQLPASAPPPASGVTGAPASEPQRTNQPS